MIVSGVLGLLNGVLGIFGKRSEAVVARNQSRIDNMQRTWVDEILVFYWFSPSVIAWFDVEKSVEMQNAMTSNQEFFGIQVAITLAVFGINKLKGKR